MYGHHNHHLRTIHGGDCTPHEQRNLPAESLTFAKAQTCTAILILMLHSDRSALVGAPMESTGGKEEDQEPPGDRMMCCSIQEPKKA